MHPLYRLAIIQILAAVCSAREITVAKPEELKAALAAVLPGDTLTLKNGTWSDAKVAIAKGGEAGKPVVVRAETPGSVVLNGASSLDINAPYVTVDGLFFHNGALAHGSVIAFNSHHGIVCNTAIIDYNPAAFDTRYYWVFFTGDHNLLDQCYFKGKNNAEPLVGNDNTHTARYNAVTRCYFKDIPYADANGREILRIWGYGKNGELGDDGAFFTIEGNLFDHADGEGSEIISLKSNRNIVRRNTVIATRGCINIRQGNYNTVEDNIILGQDIPRAAGLRMSGQHNTVRNNFVSRCDHGIVVSCGDYFEADLTGHYKTHAAKSKSVKKSDLGISAKYAQNKFLTLTGNVVIESKNLDLEIGAAYKKHWPESQMVLLPEECRIENNRFVRAKDGISVAGTIPETAAPLDRFSFKPNTYGGNVIVGGENSYAPSSSGFKIEPLPKDWSEAQELAKFKPLTPADVGPQWLARDR